jgi:hypothetical protein
VLGNSLMNTERSIKLQKKAERKMYMFEIRMRVEEIVTDEKKDFLSIAGNWKKMFYGFVIEAR